MRKKIVGIVIFLSLSSVMMSQVEAGKILPVSKSYGSCLQLRVVYKNGIAKTKTVAKKSGAVVNSKIYLSNQALDSNKNGIACDSKDVDNPFGGSSPEDFLMPNVVCANLQAAQDKIQDHGVYFSRSRDASGRGRSQFIDSNWIVISQSPAPGKKISEGSPVLTAVKIGESTRGICK